MEILGNNNIITIRKNFFSNRIVAVWNSLPSSIVSAETPAAFKTLINKHNLSKFLIFPCVLH